MRRWSRHRGLLGPAVAGILALTACTPAGETSRLDAAYDAMGGEALDMVTAVKVTAQIQQSDPGQSYSVSDLAAAEGGEAQLVQTRDFANGLTRNEWDRPGVPGRRTFVEIVTPNAGYVIGSDSNLGPLARTVRGETPQQTMSGKRLTTTLRELERQAVVLLMKRNPDKVTEIPDETVTGQTYPALQYQGDYAAYTVMFDPATNLPARVRTRDWDQHLGDSNFDLILADWRDVDGVQIPHRQTYSLNDYMIMDITLTEVMTNPPLDPQAFAVPEALQGQQAAAPAPADETPFQWVLRRQFFGWYTDSDAQYTDDGGGIMLTDIGPNLSQAVGGSHNALIIATDTYLVAVDAPGDDRQSKMVMDLAAEKYPGKPFRYLILTHHHIDHSGGIRAYAAAGATIVAGAGTAPFYSRVLTAPQTLNIHAPANPITPNIVEVTDKWSVNDGGRVIEAYAVENPHAEGMLIAYVPDAELGYVTDIHNPGFPLFPNPGLTALVTGVEKAGLMPETFAGGHGGVSPYAEAAAVGGATPPAGAPAQ